MILRIDKDGPHVTLQPDRRPDTILEAEPAVVLGLAAGAISYEEAQSEARVHGDLRVLTTVLGAAQP
jgi:hypothetical protein